MYTCILREPDLADMLQVPDLSLFSPPAPIPEVKPEPVVSGTEPVV